MIMSGRSNLFSSEGEDWVKNALSSMRDAALSDTLVYSILRQIRAESEKNGCSEKEQERIQTIEQLQKRLSRTQLSTFGIIEQLYMKEATMCLQIAFPRGIYAAFQHCFSPNENNTLERLVMETIENVEKMEQFPELSKNRKFRLGALSSQSKSAVATAPQRCKSSVNYFTVYLTGSGSRYIRSFRLGVADYIQFIRLHSNMQDHLNNILRS